MAAVIRLSARVRGAGAAVLVTAAALTVSPSLAGPADAATYVPISGAGSTAAANAVQQWAADLQPQGLTVRYAATGSSDGRSQFRNSTVDFAVTEIPYGLTDNGVTDTPPTRQFTYVPLVAGALAFPYNLTVNGARVTDLRLSDAVLAGIFTGTITRWSDARIAADNPGRPLPDIPVVPVVRADGSGTTYTLTSWFAARQPVAWNAFCVAAGRSSCGPTSQYPSVSGSGAVAQVLSAGVVGYVAQASSNGAITYAEYAYALNAALPTAQVLNAAGYYARPVPGNVSIGLLAATQNSDRTVGLQGVWTNPDPRAYPLPTISLMVVPTAVEGSFTTAKGNSLADFVGYAVCTGQTRAAPLGYAPLPASLTATALGQAARIPGATAANLTLSGCQNPTLAAGADVLLANVPQPQACDKQGATVCGAGSTGPSPTPSPTPSWSPSPTPSGSPDPQPSPSWSPLPSWSPAPSGVPSPSSSAGVPGCGRGMAYDSGRSRGRGADRCERQERDHEDQCDRSPRAGVQGWWKRH